MFKISIKKTTKPFLMFILQFILRKYKKNAKNIAVSRLYFRWIHAQCFHLGVWSIAESIFFFFLIACIVLCVHYSVFCCSLFVQYILCCVCMTLSLFCSGCTFKLFALFVSVMFFDRDPRGCIAVIVRVYLSYLVLSMLCM